jgi:hypothetical protein
MYGSACLPLKITQYEAISIKGNTCVASVKESLMTSIMKYKCNRVDITGNLYKSLASALEFSGARSITVIGGCLGKKKKKEPVLQEKKPLMNAMESMGTPTNCHQHRKKRAVARVWMCLMDLMTNMTKSRTEIKSNEKQE